MKEDELKTKDPSGKGVLIAMFLSLIIGAISMFVSMGIVSFFSSVKSVETLPIGPGFATYDIIEKSTGDVIAVRSVISGRFFYHHIDEKKTNGDLCLKVYSVGKRTGTEKEKCYNKTYTSEYTFATVEQMVKPIKSIPFVPKSSNTLSCKLYILSEGSRHSFPVLSFYCKNKS